MSGVSGPRPSSFLCDGHNMFVTVRSDSDTPCQYAALSQTVCLLAFRSFRFPDSGQGPVVFFHCMAAHSLCMSLCRSAFYMA